MINNVRKIKYQGFQYIKDDDRWLCNKGDSLVCSHSDSTMREFVVSMIHGGKTVKIAGEGMVIE